MSKQIATIALKTVHNDILKDNKNATITTKKMRVKLRSLPEMQKIHDKNSSWVFTQSQYDQVRAMFDPAYAKKIAKPAKVKVVKEQPAATADA